jgi:DNA-binding response OmpR family regulator
LLIDPDLTWSATLQAWLERAGYIVIHAADAQTARLQVGRVHPDLIVLELVLPDEDGLVLCSELQEPRETPILICSATKRRQDPALAFRLGAAAFMIKPTDLDELAARLGAIARRTRTPTAVPAVHQKEVYRVGELVVERQHHRVRVGEQDVPVTPTEYRLLVVLAGEPGMIFSRGELALRVWGYQEAGSGRGIDAHIARLRKKLAATTVRAPAIVTVRAGGYTLAPQPPT